MSSVALKKRSRAWNVLANTRPITYPCWRELRWFFHLTHDSWETCAFPSSRRLTIYHSPSHSHFPFHFSSLVRLLHFYFPFPIPYLASHSQFSFLFPSFHYCLLLRFSTLIFIPFLNLALHSPSPLFPFFSPLFLSLSCINILSLSTFHLFFPPFPNRLHLFPWLPAVTCAPRRVLVFPCSVSQAHIGRAGADCRSRGDGRTDATGNLTSNGLSHPQSFSCLYLFILFFCYILLKMLLCYLSQGGF